MKEIMKTIEENIAIIENNLRACKVIMIKNA